MAQGIRVIVMNSDESFATKLRAKLLKKDGIRIVAEFDEPAVFASALENFPAELVVVNLDPEPESYLAMAQGVLASHPELCLFAISESNDSDLILKAMRTGFREFILRPIDDEQLGQAIDRMAKTVSAGKPGGKLVCVFGPNGGCGATTLATNLACELAQMGRKKTAIVDLDLIYGHVATLLDVTPQFTIADLCQSLERIDTTMVDKALVRHESGAMVLARPQDFAQAAHISAANMSNVLTTLCEMYEYVICDGPTRHDEAVQAVFDLADVTLMVSNLLVPSVRSVDRIFRELARQGYNMDRIKLVINRHSTDSALLSAADVEECLGRKIEYRIPDEPRVVFSSINVGQPLLINAPKSRVREAIRGLAMRIHDPDSYGGDNGTASKGLFSLSKVFGK